MRDRDETPVPHEPAATPGTAAPGAVSSPAAAPSAPQTAPSSAAAPGRPVTGGEPAGPAVLEKSVHELGSAATGSFHDPHTVLGAHPYRGAVTVRTLKPLAHRVEIVLPDGSAVPAEHEYDGIWRAVVEVESLPRYTVRVTWAEGEAPVEIDDPYRFLPTLGELDLHLIREGRHEELWRALGSHVREVDGAAGTSFAVWAPRARAVQVVGDLNGWDGRAHALRSLGESGVWEIFIPGVAEGAVYKYRILGADGV